MCNKWMQPQTHWWQILKTVCAVLRKYCPTISLNCVIAQTHWYNKMNQYGNPSMQYNTTTNQRYLRSTQLRIFSQPPGLGIYDTDHPRPMQYHQACMSPSYCVRGGIKDLTWAMMSIPVPIGRCGGQCLSRCCKDFWPRNVDATSFLLRIGKGMIFNTFDSLPVASNPFLCRCLTRHEFVAVKPHYMIDCKTGMQVPTKTKYLIESARSAATAKS